MVKKKTWIIISIIVILILFLIAVTTCETSEEKKEETKEGTTCEYNHDCTLEEVCNPETKTCEPWEIY